MDTKHRYQYANCTE